MQTASGLHRTVQVGAVGVPMRTFVAWLLVSSLASVRVPSCCLLVRQLFACIASDSLEWQGDCKFWRVQSRYAQRLV